MLFKECIEHTFQFLVKTVLHVVNSILCVGMTVENNVTRDLLVLYIYIYVWHLICNKFNLIKF
jgi:hypothetical protein